MLASIKCRPLLVSALFTSLVGCQSFSSSDINSFPSDSDEFRSRFYTGASLGQSRLNPDAAGTDFLVESISSAGTQLRLGYDFHRSLAVELDTAQLGSSALGEANTGVEYSAVTLSALIYGFGGVQKQSRREGFSSFVRLGYGQLNKVSIIDDFDFSGFVPILGVGAEYGFANGFGIRTEVTRFDSDVSYVGLGGIFRFGKSSKNNHKSYVTATAEPLRAESFDVPASVPVQALAVVQSPERLLGNNPVSLASTDVRAPVLSRTNTQAIGSQGSLADRWRPAKRHDDSDSDGVLDGVDECPATGRFITVGSDGCGLFDQILTDVIFTKGSALLNSDARNQLDEVAAMVLAFPESRIQISAHTDAGGSAHGNMSLSILRATAVSEYLRSRGIDRAQLLAMGFGETQPIAGNNTPAGRMKNRRIELVTLPDLDADSEQLAFVQAAPSLPLKRVSRVSLSSIGHPREMYSSTSDKRKHQASGAAASLAVKKFDKITVSSVAKAESETVVIKKIPSKKTASKETASKETASKKTASKKTASKKTASKEPILLSAEVALIPEPGYAPGVAIAGIIEGVEFVEKSALLTDAGKAALMPVVQRLLNKPKIAIAVMAHSDDLGEESDNENLTMDQAQTIVEYFVASGIAVERLQAEGYGELLPLVQNLTEEDRARNRRVELRILPSWPKRSE